MKHILHIDMDAFFASVEELQDKKYLNKPIIVSGRTKRSVVSSANYIARSFGVKAAMPIFIAQKLCPKAIIVVPHFHLYSKYHNLFVNLIREQFTNNIEVTSIDELYVDITSLINKNNNAVAIASKIQIEIKKQTGLSCSVGISNNKFLAKMASDYKKPFGITTMYPNEIKEKLWPQPIEQMQWIGKNTAIRLKEHGINFISDIANKKNNVLLEQLLDKNWKVHYLHANGYGDDQLDYSHNLPKSISESETFLNDTNDFDEIVLKLKSLTENVIDRLNEIECVYKTISVFIKTPDFKVHNKSLTINHYSNDLTQTLTLSLDIYKEFFIDKTIRLIGMGISNIIPKKELESDNLFDKSHKTKKIYQTNQLNNVIEQINNKFSKDILVLASDKLKK